MLTDFVRRMVRHFSSLGSKKRPGKADGREIISSPDVYIANKAVPKGRGVFANRDFSAGEIIERCPVLIIDEPREELPEQLKRIVFDWNLLDGASVSSAVALGCGNLYNHGNPSNARYEIETEQSLLVFKTIRRVEKGEELTVNYDAIAGGPAWEIGEWPRKDNLEPISASTGVSTLRLQSPDVCVRDTGTPKGRGAFAGRHFLQGEVVAECPVILFKAPFSPPGELRRLVFSWLALVKTSGPYAYALALGCGSLFNHDNPANMRYEPNPENFTLKFIAARSINTGEELTINYNAADGDAHSDNNSWFERARIKPI